MTIIKEKKEPDDKLAELKQFTKYLFSNVEFPFEKFKYFDTTLKYKLFSYVKNNLSLCRYVNEYLNGTYVFNDIDNEDLITTFKFLFTQYNIDKYKIYYGKYQKNEFDTFVSFIKSQNIELNRNELLSLYRLYETGIINDKLKSKAESVPIQKQKITHTINDFKIVKTNRTACKNCALYNYEMVALETNANDIKDVDLLVIGGFVSESDISDKLFTDTKYINIRYLLDKLIQNHKLTYVFTNLILCAGCNKTTNKRELSAISKSCESLRSQILDNINCSLILYVDDFAFSTFKYKFDKSDVKIYNNRLGIKEIPNKIKNDALLIDTYNTLDSFFIKNKKQTHQSYEIKNELMVNKLTKDLTLFNIQIIDNDVIYILIDENGEKKYYTEPIKFPIYIKNNSYGGCKHVDSEFNEYCILNNSEKIELGNMLFKKLNSWKRFN